MSAAPVIQPNARTLMDAMRAGVATAGDAAFLRATTPDAFAAELQGLGYAVTMQRRTIGKKWEMGLARSCEWNSTVVLDANGMSVRTTSLPTYRDCVLLEAEDGRLTSVVWLERLTLEPGTADAGVVVGSAAGTEARLRQCDLDGDGGSGEAGDVIAIVARQPGMEEGHAVSGGVGSANVGQRGLEPRAIRF